MDYREFPEKLKENPEYAKNMFHVLKSGMTDKNNDSESLIEAYKALYFVVKENPGLSEEVFEAFKVGLASEENNSDSLITGYWKLSAVVEAHPELAKDVFEVLKVGLANKKNSDYTINYAENLIKEIIKNNEELSSEAKNYGVRKKIEEHKDEVRIKQLQSKSSGDVALQRDVRQR